MLRVEGRTSLVATGKTSQRNTASILLGSSGCDPDPPPAGGFTVVGLGRVVTTVFLGSQATQQSDAVELSAH